MTALSNKHIFIVEDDLPNRIVFQMALIRHGASVEFERCGQDTLFYLCRTPHVDLIILDLMLAHNISGFDLIDEIRALPEFDHVPVVAVSAMDSAVAIPQAKEKGFSGFIPKPIDNHWFPKQIAAIIAGEQVWHVEATVRRF